MSETHLTTHEILTKLREARTTRTFSEFMARYGDQLEAVPFSEYIAQLCKEKGLSKAEAITNAGIERKYGYSFLNNERAPSRDKALQFAIGLGLNLSETQELLKAAKHRELNIKFKRDASIVFAIEHGYDIIQAQKILAEAKEKSLGDETHG